MAITACFWRALKSPRAKVLLNLCVAIAFTCALAVFEGLARNKVGILVYALKLFKNVGFLYLYIEDLFFMSM